jgi:LPS export ABC transporter permease LptG/LPS export ABC transporter permease LptF
LSIISRAVFREVATSALLGTVLFTFILFLRSLGKLAEQLVRGSAAPETVAYLSGLVFIPTLTFAVPVGVLVGILIGLSRQASDNEITALRASGVPARRLLWPVMTFAFAGFLVAGAATVWLTPWSIRETGRIINELAADQLTAEIQERVFDEQFPNMILYVGGVDPGPVVRWRNVFMADTTPSEQRTGGISEKAQGPRVTFAEEAIAVADPKSNRIQLSLRNAQSHELGKDPTDDINSAFPSGDQALEAKKPVERVVRPYPEMDSLPLFRMAYAAGPRNIDALIELHQRLALPLACFLLAMVGLPLGISQRKAGKSVSFVLTVLLAFLYYMSFISLVGLARQGTLGVEVAVWLPNVLFGLTGLILLVRLERPGDFDLIGLISGRLREMFASLAARFERRAERGGRRWAILPQIIDTYVLNTFFFYFGLLLLTCVLLTEVFTFFELLGDIVKNNITMTRVLTYLYFLIPKFIYDFTPVSVLVAVLVTFGVLSKNNEVTAFKACGVSLFRLVAPVLAASAVLSGALFAFDYYYVPDANRKQDAIRNEIKGNAPQSFLRPDRKYIYGQGSRIYYYRYFEPADSVMLDVNVYEIDPKHFRLQHVITAERARWEPSIKTWVFQNGYRRTFDGVRVKKFDDFGFRGEAASFAHLNEPPSYFLKEVKLSSQMNFHELRKYMGELQQSGFDTTRLQVQYHSKFSVPLFALIMALIAAPFGFLAGNRGAMTGIGVSLGIGIAYLTVNKLFEQIGNLNQLPAQIAAWSPDVVFSLAGLYLIARMKT